MSNSPKYIRQDHDALIDSVYINIQECYIRLQKAYVMLLKLLGLKSLFSGNGIANKEISIL